MFRTVVRTARICTETRSVCNGRSRFSPEAGSNACQTFAPTGKGQRTLLDDLAFLAPLSCTFPYRGAYRRNRIFWTTQFQQLTPQKMDDVRFSAVKCRGNGTVPARRAP